MTRARNCFLAVAIAALGLALRVGRRLVARNGRIRRKRRTGCRRQPRRCGLQRGRRRERATRAPEAARVLARARVAVPDLPATVRPAVATRDPEAARVLARAPAGMPDLGGNGAAGSGQAGSGGRRGRWRPGGIRGRRRRERPRGCCRWRRRVRLRVWRHRRRDLRCRTVLRLRQRPVWGRRPAGPVRPVGWCCLPATDRLRLRRKDLLLRLRGARQRRRHDEHDLVHSRQRRRRRPLRCRHRLHDWLQVLRERRGGRVANRLPADSRRRVLPGAALASSPHGAPLAVSLTSRSDSSRLTSGGPPT